ncbi:MAG: PAS domain S-box protein [Candidatus Zixiibacteriota bacterium]|nr:MAG: PAS domain S-box protein [candidate division Zixibacteria bacterium]
MRDHPASDPSVTLQKILAALQARLTGTALPPEEATRICREIQALTAAYTPEAERPIQTIEGLQCGVAVYQAVDEGRDFVFLGFNAAAERLDGLPRSQVLGRRLREVFPGVEQFGLLEVLQRVWRTGQPEDHPITHYQDERLLAWRENHVYRLPGGEVVAVYSDATRRRQAEESLSKYAALLQDLRDVVLLVRHRDGRLLEANDAALAAYGYTYDELLARTIFDLRPADGESLIRAQLDKARDNGVLFEAEHRRKDGSTFPVEISSHAVTVGGEVCLLSVVRDISQRRRMREQIETLAGSLQQERDVLNAIMENTDTHLAYLDAGFHFVHVNSAYVRGSGHRREELIGRHHFELFPDAENQAIFEKVRDTGEPIRFTEKPFAFPDQPERGTTWWDWTLIPVKDDRGRLQGLAFSLQDVTRRKLAEEVIKASLKEKETLLKEIHHRVKNNLQIISALLGLQSQNLRGTDAANVLRESQSRVKSIALVHERLYRSHDLASIRMQDYLLKLLQGLFHTYGAHNRGITLSADISGIELDIDTAMPLGLIVNEITSNALKHAFPEGREGQIAVALSRGESGGLCLAMRDDGVGIPEGMDFERSDTLGLQLVATLTRQLGGTLEVRHGGGTEISLTLPAEKNP